MTRVTARAAAVAGPAALVAAMAVGVCVVVALFYGLTGYVIPWIWWWIVSLPQWVWWAATGAALVWVVVTYVLGERRYKRGES